MFNHGLRGRRGGDTSGITGLSAAYVEAKSPQVTINGYFVTGTDDLALDIAGGQTITVTGGGFISGITGTIGGVTIGAITYISPTQVSFTSPAKSGGLYALVLTNTNGNTGALVPGLLYSSVPAFTTSAGSIGTVYETVSYSKSVAATSDSAIRYTLASGSLPADATLNVSTGAITGTVPTIASGSTTYSFSITAIDAENQDVTRSFTITESTDVLAWVAPSNSATINLDGTTYSQALTATDGAGYGVTYTANALPTGLTLSSGTISGTPTVAGSTSTLLTATAATTTRSATNNITWVVALGDTFWKYTTLLLNGETSVTPFINDASLNNSQLTIAGDARQDTFNPYMNDGYYGVSFNGSTDNLVFGTSCLPTTAGVAFTLEFWMYFTRPTSSVTSIISSGNMELNIDTAIPGQLRFDLPNGVTNVMNSGSTVLKPNTWTHIAITRTSANAYTMYFNGVVVGTGSSATAISTLTTFGYKATDRYQGYISNLRTVNALVYTSAFTPSTAPLTAIANTLLLTCQSNTFIDKSLSPIVITLTGTPKITSTIPFTTPTSVTVNTGYSVQMNGSGNYVSVAGGNAGFNFGTGDLTIEGWIYFKSGSTYTLFDNRTAGTSVNISVQEYNTFLSVFIGGSSQVINSNITPTIGQWYHLAVVRISGIMKLYVNGTQAGSSYTSSQNFTGVAGPVCIGGGYPTGTNSPLTGYISNVRVVKGLGVYTGNFTVPNSPLTSTQSAGTNISAITAGQTVLLTCQDSTGKDNSSSAQAVSINGTAQPVNNAYPFTQTTTTVSNLNTLGSAYFDGTGDCLTIPSNAAFQFGTGDYTIETWIWPNDLSSNNTNNFINIGTYLTGILMRTTSSSGIQLYLLGVSKIPVQAGLTAKAWNHVALVRIGTTCTLYINGTSNYSFTDSSNLSPSTATVTIGMAAHNSGEFFTGYISDMRIIKGTALYTGNFLPPTQPLTAVTNTQLLTLQYNGGASNYGIIDNGPFNNPITRFGNTTQGTFSPYSQTGWSNYFNGTTDTFSIATGTVTIGTATDYTVEAWIYVTGTTGAIQCISTGQNNGVGFIVTTALKLQWNKVNVGGGYTSTGTLSLNQWTHVSVCRVSGVANFWINGVLAGSNADATAFSSTSTQISGSAAAFYFMGYISNFRQVVGTALYTTSFTPPTAPLTAINKTITLTCQSNRFIDNGANGGAVTVTSAPSIQAFSPFGSVREATSLSYSNYFDGTGDYLSTPDNAAFTLGTNDFTVESWVYPITITSGNNNILAQWTTGGLAFIFRYVAAGRPQFSSGATNVTGTTTAVVVNQWNHVAITRTSGTIRLFVNGVLDATTGTVGSCPDSASQVTIGAYSDGTSEYVTGYISNLRLINGTSLYSTNFTPSTTPLTAVSNTVLLACQSPTIIDNSTNKFTLTAAGDTKPKQFNPFGYTAQSAASYTPSLHGGSAYFDGTGDYLSSAGTLLALGTNDFTIDCWIYRIQSGTNDGIYTAGRSPDAAGGFGLKVSSANQLAWNTNTSYGSGTTIISIGQWYHVACTRQSNVLKFWINGVLDYTNAAFTQNCTNPTALVGITDDPFYTNMYISDFRIINGTSLYNGNFVPPTTPATSTPSTSLLLSMTNGGIVDAHSGAVLETVGNTQLASEDPYSETYYSNFSDGNGDYLTVPSASWSTLAGTFTVEFWIRWNSAIASAGSFMGVQANGGFTFYNDNSSISPNIYGSANIFNSSFAPSSVVPGKWYHIAVTRNSSNLMTMWVDGVSVGSVTTATTYTQGAWAIFSPANVGLLIGNISNHRVTNTCLYTTTFTPSTVPLTAVSGTQLLTCQSNRFKDNSTNAATLTAYNTVAVKSFNPFQNNTGKSLYFDGTGDYLDLPLSQNFSQVGPWTIEMWIYPTAANNCYIYSQVTSNFLQFNLAANMILNIDRYGVGNLLSSSTAISLNTWTHIALVSEGSTVKLYSNGSQSGSTASYSTVTASATTTRIGAYQNGGSAGTLPFTGYIDDLRITKGVARYTTTFTPPTSQLKTK